MILDLKGIKPGNKMSFANFHTHTYFSDGDISPEGLVDRIFATDSLDYFSVTDHDTLSAIEPVFRCLRHKESGGRKFVPGIELSLRDRDLDLSIHLVGLFPWINQENHARELVKLDEVLGGFCREQCRLRGDRDVDSRIHHAFSFNLEGIGERYSSAEEVIELLRAESGRLSETRFRQSEKAGDVIQHPIPRSYQVIINNWERIMPGSSREKITYYILRPDQNRERALARIYEAEGMTEAGARQKAHENQGVLTTFARRPSRDTGIMDGLEYLRKAGAVTFLAHPAVDHHKVGYEEYDRKILAPLAEGGLDGIEVFYPYDRTYRQEAVQHYKNLADRQGLLVSGGTDFHGDDRVGLDDVKLSPELADRIIDYGLKRHPVS